VCAKKCGILYVRGRENISGESERERLSMHLYENGDMYEREDDVSARLRKIICVFETDCGLVCVAYT
jgi:hypothetical protein